ncbi:MFS transporter [Leekyejoonella antrihumi]|uniref:MFS transporter n=1 Tax=Leekyejoonella antrihumi TaxID=1660198 RepID=A0A563DTW0_9MICO|nr:MFS transporter [Leekyejoonella antrihumi]
MVWASAISVYVLAVFHRTSLGVAGVVAAQRFHISSAQLATFTMVQLLVYAAMQVPVGALLDRFGSRALLITGVVTMSLAQFSFAFADTFAAGLLARIFVGMGDAMTFVSVLRIVMLWFPPARTPMVTQITGIIGQLGAVVAAVPLSAALHAFGWKTSFLAAASAGVVLGAVLLVVVKDSPYVDQARTQIKVRAVGRAVRHAWNEPGTRLGLWCHFTSQFASTVFALMWGFPFLVKGEGLSATTASLLLSLMVVAAIAASPVFGALVTRFPYSRSSLVLVQVALMVLTWTVVLLWPTRAPLWMLIVLVVITAIGGPGSMVGFDLARTFNPPTRLGSATGIVNVGGFTASFSSVVLIGVVLDHLSPGGPDSYDLHAFRWAFCVQYVVWAIGIIQILRLRRKTRVLVHRQDDYAHLIPAGPHRVPRAVRRDRERTSDARP